MPRMQPSHKVSRAGASVPACCFLACIRVFFLFHKAILEDTSTRRTALSNRSKAPAPQTTHNGERSLFEHLRPFPILSRCLLPDSTVTPPNAFSRLFYPVHLFFVVERSVRCDGCTTSNISNQWLCLVAVSRFTWCRVYKFSTLDTVMCTGPGSQRTI